MSQENVKVVKRSQDHFATTGQVLWETLDPGIEVYDHDIPDAPYHRGHDGYAEWAQSWGDAWDEFSVEPLQYIDAGDRVIGVFRMRARGRDSGLELDREDAIVYTLRDGLITRLDYYNNLPEALEAVGLRE